MICPAYAGVIPPPYSSHWGMNDLSRVCGDEPIMLAGAEQELRFVPRMRGGPAFASRLLFFLSFVPRMWG